MTAPIDPRSITDAERPYLDDLTDLGQMADLRRRIIEAGHRPATANGLVAWLLTKKVGDPDLTDSGTRSNYRRVLRELQEQDAPKGRRRGRPAEAGHAGLPSTVGVAAGVLVGAVASAVAGPAAGLLGLPVALYVTEIMGGGPEGAGRR